MSTSPNLGLTLTPESESSKRFIDFRTELAGDQSTSNMMKIDAAIKEDRDAIDALEEDTESLKTTPFTWGMLKNGFSG